MKTSKKQKAELDKATRAMLTMGALTKGYEQPDKPTPGERHKKFKMRVDNKGRGNLKDVKD